MDNALAHPLNPLQPARLPYTPKPDRMEHAAYHCYGWLPVPVAGLPFELAGWPLTRRWVRNLLQQVLHHAATPSWMSDYPESAPGRVQIGECSVTAPASVRALAYYDHPVIITHGPDEQKAQLTRESLIVAVAKSLPAFPALLGITGQDEGVAAIYSLLRDNETPFDTDAPVFWHFADLVLQNALFGAKKY